jgi:hypothetical protein
MQSSLLFPLTHILLGVLRVLRGEWLFVWLSDLAL